MDGPIPLWTGGRGPSRTPATAARFCSGWNVPYVGPDEYRRLNDRIDAACEAIGRDPATLERSVNLAFHLGATPDAAAAELRRIREQWGAEADRITAGALTGTPDDAVEQIGAFRDAGADMVNIALRLPVDQDALDAYLDLVLPAARAEIV
jgi:alkanesulfonate monooxygenase SsuD/methylene tetrahydromethanopterin reductase-like flavin-dependent oxidoreductase (luciferase family)